MNDDRPGNHWRRVRQGLDEAVRGWLYDPNVRYIDYGFPEKDTELRLDDEPHIRVHVVHKFQQGPALEAATERGITRGEIPDQFAGIPVDRPQSSYRPHQPPWSAGGWTLGGPSIFSEPVNLRTRRTAPLRGGISVSDQYRRIAGTLGGPVVDRRTGALMLLSNWHVLSGVSGRPGWSIYQPGRGDGGGMADRRGHARARRDGCEPRCRGGDVDRRAGGGQPAVGSPGRARRQPGAARDAGREVGADDRRDPGDRHRRRTARSGCTTPVPATASSGG